MPRPRGSYARSVRETNELLTASRDSSRDVDTLVRTLAARAERHLSGSGAAGSPGGATSPYAHAQISQNQHARASTSPSFREHAQHSETATLPPRPPPEYTSGGYVGDLRYASSLPVPRSFAHYAHNNDARTYNDDAVLGKLAPSPMRAYQMNRHGEPYPATAAYRPTPPPTAEEAEDALAPWRDPYVSSASSPLPEHNPPPASYYGAAGTTGYVAPFAAQPQPFTYATSPPPPPPPHLVASNDAGHVRPLIAPPARAGAPHRNEAWMQHPPVNFLGEVREELEPPEDAVLRRKVTRAHRRTALVEELGESLRQLELDYKRREVEYATTTLEGAREWARSPRGRKTAKRKKAKAATIYARQLQCYKCVALWRDGRGQAHLRCIQDGTTTFELGKQLSNVATGFTVHMHPLEAAEAEYGRTARLRDAPRVILRCLASGRGWKRGRSLSFPLLTPIALLGEQSDEPPPADFRPRRTVGARTTGVPHLRR